MMTMTTTTHTLSSGESSPLSLFGIHDVSTAKLHGIVCSTSDNWSTGRLGDTEVGKHIHRTKQRSDMITLGQRVVVYTILLMLNIVSFVLFGILAVVPLLFSIAIVASIRRL